MPDPTEGVAQPREPLLRRLHRALGPIGGGLILDLLDLATFGPIGWYGGFVVGGLVGWWRAGLYGFPPRARPWIAAGAAVYMAVPFHRGDSRCDAARRVGALPVGA